MNKNKLPDKYNYRPLPNGFYIGFSDIEGNGLFTNLKLNKNTVIGISHKLYGGILERMPLGAFINYSSEPNCIIRKSEFKDNEYVLETIRDIDNEEITVDYYKSDCGLDKICQK